MANYPSNFQTKERLQPGGRGEIFQVDIPGYRDGADRINRTNEHINTSAHDVPNIKYLLDNRLPVLFKYGFENSTFSFLSSLIEYPFHIKSIFPLLSSDSFG